MEAPIGLLIPPACRDEVLGDLYQRYAGPRQYLLDALHTVPLVIASRVRRTTDPAVLLIEALALYLSFLLGAWYIDRALLAAQWGLWRLAIPAAAALLAMVLRDAYATPGIRSRWEAVLRPAVLAGPPVVDRAVGRRLEYPAGLHLADGVSAGGRSAARRGRTAVLATIHNRSPEAPTTSRRLCRRDRGGGHSALAHPAFIPARSSPLDCACRVLLQALHEKLANRQLPRDFLDRPPSPAADRLQLQMRLLFRHAMQALQNRLGPRHQLPLRDLFFQLPRHLFERLRQLAGTQYALHMPLDHIERTIAP